jgi:Flp pilus assembly protein TadD
MEPSHRTTSCIPSGETVIPTRKHLDYALGYLGLNLLAEARAELAMITPADREKTEVLSVQLELAMAQSAWKRVIRLASKITRESPADERPWIAWAYALRELQAVGDALDILIMGEAAIDRPSPLVDYNLACYHCLLGDLTEARRRLKRACAREPSWKTEAATDPDLADLHRDHNS